MEDYISVDISYFYRFAQALRNGNITWYSQTGEQLYSVLFKFEQEPVADVFVTFAPQMEERTYRVRLTLTSQFFGGRRLWFRCPMNANGATCGRRARLLYFDPVLGKLGCRICLDLTYESCRSSHRYDALFSFIERVTKQSKLPSAF